MQWPLSVSFPDLKLGPSFPACVVCQPKHNLQCLGRNHRLSTSDDRHAPAPASKHGWGHFLCSHGQQVFEQLCQCHWSISGCSRVAWQCRGSAGKVCFAATAEDHLTFRQHSASVRLGFVFKTWHCRAGMSEPDGQPSPVPCYHIWEHQATPQRMRTSNTAQDVASCTIPCSLTDEAVLTCLLSTPVCAELWGHPSPKWPILVIPF